MPEFENHLTSNGDDRPQPPNGENRSHVEIQVLEPPLPPRSRSIRRSRRQSSRRSNSSAETITMQESSAYGGGGRPRQPVTLKASFLRRKIAEYEGNKVDNSSSSFSLYLLFCSLSCLSFIHYTLGALELVIHNITPHYCISRSLLYVLTQHISHHSHISRTLIMLTPR